jgi:hypothetical protein
MLPAFSLRLLCLGLGSPFLLVGSDCPLTHPGSAVCNFGVLWLNPLMTDRTFAVMAVTVLLLFSGVGLILLIRPALHFRIFPNPLMRNTPWNRLQMRTVGLVLCLFILLVATGGGAGAPKRKTLEGFHNNILIALWVSVFAAPVISWILWRFSVDFLVRRGHIDPTMEDPTWERGMTLTFCSLLLSIALIALYLAARGHHPQFKTSLGTSLLVRDWNSSG